MNTITQKYQIGQKVFLLNEHKVIESIVQGVVTIYDSNQEYLFYKKEQKFVEYKYFFQKKADTERYGWVSEKKIFSSKTDLLASL